MGAPALRAVSCHQLVPDLDPMLIHPSSAQGRRHRLLRLRAPLFLCPLPPPLPFSLVVALAFPSTRPILSSRTVRLTRDAYSLPPPLPTNLPRWILSPFRLAVRRRRRRKAPGIFKLTLVVCFKVFSLVVLSSTFPPSSLHPCPRLETTFRVPSPSSHSSLISCLTTPCILFMSHLRIQLWVQV